jgi:hypothetical protein
MDGSPEENDCLTTMPIRVGHEPIYDCAPDADGADVDHPSHALHRYHRSRPDHREAIRPHDVLEGWLWQLMRPPSAPPGRLRLSARALLNDTGEPDSIALSGGC